MALSLSASLKWVNLYGGFRLRVGVLERLYLWTYGTHTLMTDQTEVRNAKNVRKRHFVVNKKMFCVFTGQTTGNSFRVTL